MKNIIFVLIVFALFSNTHLFAQSGSSLDLIYPDNEGDVKEESAFDFNYLLQELQSGELLNNLDFNSLLDQFSNEMEMSSELLEPFMNLGIDTLFEQIDTIDWNGASRVIQEQLIDQLNDSSLDDLLDKFNELFYDQTLGK